MLDIPRDTFDRAYNNVANSVLWFVQHLLFDTPNQPQFGREFRRDWAAYLAYNEAFADAMAEGAAAGDRGRILSQRPRADPGLPPQPGAAAAAGEARRRPPATPASRTSRTRPGRRPTTTGCCRREVGEAVLDGMLGADHAGFHAEPVGRRVPRLLRGDPGRGGEPGRPRKPGHGRAGHPPGARHRGCRASAGRGRPGAARPRAGRRRAGVHHRPRPGGPRAES